MSRAECRKFAPNIFNKTKCTNCFKQKEEHTAEALESNRATRKIAKCGYLFVAPGWDFTNPVNRTKRWQRRWFVLYDDGEFSYALDQHPETVPQASIDMNKVIEVSNAEELTGNAFSLAITAPDNVHFVKGTCREEIRYWSDVLQVFPRSKGRHKRNATFPGPNQSSTHHSLLQTPIRGGSLCGKMVDDVYSSRISSTESSPIWEGDDVYPTRDTNTHQQSSSHDSSPLTKVYMGSPPTRDKVDSVDKCVRLRRNTCQPIHMHSDLHGKATPRSPYVDDVWQDISVQQSQGHAEVNRRLLLEEYESECKLKDIADCLTRPRLDVDKQIRGDPDGCGLDPNHMRYSPSDMRVDLPSEDLLNIKKGWLMKQDKEKEWSKHWFVLRGTGLLYYRDPGSEDQGILDGVIDLSGVTSVSESSVQRNYGFNISTWDERRYVLSAVTSGIRANWMTAIKKSAGLTHQETTTIQETSDLLPRLMALSSDEEYRTADSSTTGSTNLATPPGTTPRRDREGEWGEALPPSPPLNRTPMSRVKERARGVSKLRVYGGSSNNKRCRSSPPSSRRSTLDSISSSDTPCIATPGVSTPALHSTSPPSLSTPNSTLSPDSNKGCSEMEQVKHELNMRLRELTNAQEELLKQRQRHQDINHLQKLVEELSKRAEESGLQRARDSAEIDNLKKRYIEEKICWESSGRQLEAQLEQTASKCLALTTDLQQSHHTTDTLSQRLSDLEHRLDEARRENESLYARLSLLETVKNSSPTLLQSRSRSLDSLSDLTNIDLDIHDIHTLDRDRLGEEYMDLRVRFEKAVAEIRAMKRELREAHEQADWLELSLLSTKQEMKSREESATANNNLMAARIQDLATKLVQSEKQMRSLKMKLSKTETREKRRSLSLKGRESFTISKELEEKLSHLEARVNTMEGVSTPASTVLNQEKTEGLSLRLRRKSLDSATASEPLKVLLRLNSLEAKINRAGSSDTGSTCTTTPTSPPTSSKQPTSSSTELKLFSGDEIDSKQSEIVDEVKKMENLLRAKLVVLSKKRESLMSSGEWSDETRLHLLAEKLAYESVLVSRLHNAVTASYNSAVDNKHAQHLINGLESKVSGGGSKCMDSSLDYLVRELTKHLSQQKVKRMIRKTKAKPRSAPDSQLVNNKAIVDAKVVNFLNEAVSEVGEALAVESLCECGVEFEDTVRSLARDSVDQELVQQEIVQVMRDTCAQYKDHVATENQSRLVSMARDRHDLELWTQLSHDMLDANMNQVLSRIKHEYQMKLRKLRESGGLPEIVDEGYHERTRATLHRLADIVAHKSLLDARVALIGQQDQVDDVTDESDNQNSLLSEIQYLYVKFSSDLTNDLRDKQRIDSLVDRLGEEVWRLESSLVSSSERLGTNPVSNTDRQTSTLQCGDDWYESVASKFQLIRDRLDNIQKFTSNSSSECIKCTNMQAHISRIESEYREKMSELERQREEQVSQLTTAFQQQKQHLILKHAEEEQSLLENNSELEKQLASLQSGTISPDIPSESQTGDSLHLRYQKEIQHLRAVCEKGLTGMENSHKRQIEELQEKHERELESLRLEKEQALAEETHATLAALDAMRKAHEAEVQKEIAKFKTEFLNKMQSSHDFNLIHKQHQAEMGEIKTEILSLSEKYSIKCVENALLEDKLRSANHQLALAHQNIISLDNRCKELRQQIAEGTSVDSPHSSLHSPHAIGVEGRLTPSPV